MSSYDWRIRPSLPMLISGIDATYSSDTITPYRSGGVILEPPPVIPLSPDINQGQYTITDISKFANEQHHLALLPEPLKEGSILKIGDNDYVFKDNTWVKLDKPEKSRFEKLEE